MVGLSNFQHQNDKNMGGKVIFFFKQDSHFSKNNSHENTQKKHFRKLNKPTNAFKIVKNQ